MCMCVLFRVLCNDIKSVRRLHWPITRPIRILLCTVHKLLKNWACTSFLNLQFFIDMIISHQDLLKGVYTMGFTKPSKIQERALPLLLANPLDFRNVRTYLILTPVQTAKHDRPVPVGDWKNRSICSHNA
jgi:hypothetical protein